MQQAGGDRRGRRAGAGQRRGGADGMGEKGPAARSQDAAEQGRRHVGGNPDLGDVLGRIAEPAQLVMQLAGGLGQGGAGRPHRPQRQAGALLPGGEQSGLGNEQGTAAVEPPLGGEAVEAAAAARRRSRAARPGAASASVGSPASCRITVERGSSSMAAPAGRTASARSRSARPPSISSSSGPTRWSRSRRARRQENRAIVAGRAAELRRDVGDPAAGEAAGRRGGRRLDARSMTRSPPAKPIRPSRASP